MAAKFATLVGTLARSFVLIFFFLSTIGTFYKFFRGDCMNKWVLQFIGACCVKDRVGRRGGWLSCDSMSVCTYLRGKIIYFVRAIMNCIRDIIHVSMRTIWFRVTKDKTLKWVTQNLPIPTVPICCETQRVDFYKTSFGGSWPSWKVSRSRPTDGKFVGRCCHKDILSVIMNWPL